MVQLRREHAAMLSAWTDSVVRMCHRRVLERWPLLPLFALFERVPIFLKRVKAKPLLSCIQICRTDRWLAPRGWLPKPHCIDYARTLIWFLFSSKTMPPHVAISRLHIWAVVQFSLLFLSHYDSLWLPVTTTDDYAQSSWSINISALTAENDSMQWIYHGELLSTWRYTTIERNVSIFRL